MFLIPFLGGVDPWDDTRSGDWRFDRALMASFTDHFLVAGLL